jgi:hypothetical protein
MNNPGSLKSVALISATVAATTLLFQACGGSAVAQAIDADVIEGVFESTVTNKDCPSGAVLGAPFKALLVFHRGGTVEVDNASSRSTRGNIYGLWKRGAGAGYTANVVHQRFNADGTYAGLNKIQRTLTLAADASGFTATMAVQVLDTTGAVVGQFCPTESAVRMNL